MFLLLQPQKIPDPVSSVEEELEEIGVRLKKKPEPKKATPKKAGGAAAFADKMKRQR